MDDGQVSAEEIHFDEFSMRVELSDARTLGVPLAWFPRLLRATRAQRQRCEISFSGNRLHWQDIDGDIPVEGLLAGRGDMKHVPPRAA